MSLNSSTVFVRNENDEYIVNEEGEYLLYNPTSGEMRYTNETPPVCSTVLPSPSASVGPTVRSVSSFTDEATKCFLNILLDHKEDLRDTKLKKKNLWMEISAEMRKYNYQLDENAIERKFRNMKYQFLQIRDNNTKTGRGRKSWAYYTLMEELFENDACVNPKSSMASMMPVKIPNMSAVPSACGLSGFEIINSIHPQTEILPESSSASDVQNAVIKRRLNAKNASTQNPSCKKVRKRGGQRNDEILVKIQAAIEDSNRIQSERNELLRNFLEKFQ